MLPKIIYRLGLLACLLLIAACFMPWVTFTSPQETFTGFYTKKFPDGTYYGRPGNFIVSIAIIILILMYLPKVWAKMVNIFLSAFLLAYIFDVYIRFTNSLFENEIEKRYGIYLLVASAIVILVSSVFPDMRMKAKNKNETNE